MKNWKICENENLADIKIEVYGENRVQLLENITRAFAYLIQRGIVRTYKNKQNLSISASSFSQLVFDYISYLIYLKDAKSFLTYRANLTIHKTTLKGALIGKFITKKTPILLDIKAITHHKFSVNKNSKWKAVLVFDV